MKTMSAPDVAIREVDHSALEGAELRSLARLRQAETHERLPDDPLTPLDILEAEIHQRIPTEAPRDWVALLGTQAVGRARLQRYLTSTDPHDREAWLFVDPAYRRRGIGHRLLRRLTEACADDDEIALTSWAQSGTPGPAFAERLGARKGREDRRSELRLDAIDRDLVASWAHIDPPGYRLVWIDREISDELMGNVVAAYDTMNDAPRDELAGGDKHPTPELIRGWYQFLRARGDERRLLLAVDASTGASAGFTEVARNPRLPWVVRQHGTAVVRRHRGHDLGKWLKARMIERIFDEWGDAQFIRTGNAYSNEPMLSINDRLGFKITVSVSVYQIGIADLRRYLASRP